MIFRLLLVLSVCLLVVSAGQVLAHDELEDGYFLVIDEEGRVVLETGIVVNVGDSFIDADNRKWEIYRVEGRTAFARSAGVVDLLGSENPTWFEGFLAWWRGLVQRVYPVQGEGQRVVSIYHTHTAESYEPTDGAAFKREGGGILEVGEALAEALRDKGIEVIHDKTNHSPQDAAAYDRSRRTVSKLLRRNPDLILDVHRDTARRAAYEDQVAGQEITKVMIVVGRQNPQMSATLGLAKRMKAEADEVHPGLIKGIFFAKGKYNQDMSPRVLLIEVGSHTNDREDAERGIALLADVIPTLVGVGAPGPGQSAGETRGSFNALWWVLGLSVLGVVGYLLVSTGSLKEAREKLSRYFSTEFKDVVRLGRPEGDRREGREQAGKSGERRPDRDGEG